MLLFLYGFSFSPNWLIVFYLVRGAGVWKKAQHNRSTRAVDGKQDTCLASRKPLYEVTEEKTRPHAYTNSPLHVLSVPKLSYDIIPSPPFFLASTLNLTYPNHILPSSLPITLLNTSHTSLTTSCFFASSSPNTSKNATPINLTQPSKPPPSSPVNLVGLYSTSVLSISKPTPSNNFRISSSEGKNHGHASLAFSMCTPCRIDSAESKAVCTSATFPAPPISNTKFPPGASAAWTPLNTDSLVSLPLRIQCKAALEKTFVYFRCCCFLPPPSPLSLSSFFPFPSPLGSHLSSSSKKFPSNPRQSCNWKSMWGKDRCAAAMRLGEESYPVMEWQKGSICEVRIPSPHPMSRIVSEDWGESQVWIVVVSCGTKDAEAEYASAVQWSSGRVLGGVDIFFFGGGGVTGWSDLCASGFYIGGRRLCLKIGVMTSQ